MSALASKRKQEEDQLAQAQQQSLNLRLDKERAIKDVQEQQHAVQKQQLQSLSHQIQAEQQRKQGLKESLGLMNPNTLRTMLHVSRKVKAGQAVTQNELEFMKGHGDVFGSQLQKIGAGMAAKGPNAAMIQELMQNTGQDKREQVLAKQRLEVANTINMNVKLDEQALANLWGQRVMPEFLKIVRQMQHGLDSRIAQMQNELMTRQRSMFPQF